MGCPHAAKLLWFSHPVSVYCMQIDTAYWMKGLFGERGVDVIKEDDHKLSQRRFVQIQDTYEHVAIDNDSRLMAQAYSYGLKTEGTDPMDAASWHPTIRAVMTGVFEDSNKSPFYGNYMMEIGLLQNCIAILSIR